MRCSCEVLWLAIFITQHNLTKYKENKKFLNSKVILLWEQVKINN
jgi:hypothetical protein